MGNDKKTIRREGIKPIKRVYTYVLFLVTSFLKHEKMVKIAGFHIQKINKEKIHVVTYTWPTLFSSIAF